MENGADWAPFSRVLVALGLKSENAVALGNVGLVRNVRPATDFLTCSQEAGVDPCGEVAMCDDFAEHFVRCPTEAVIDLVLELTKLTTVVVDQLCKRRAVLGVVLGHHHIVLHR